MKIKSIHEDRYRRIVERLSEERVRLGISQSELGKAIGFNQSDISKIEKFERRLDVLELSWYMAALRVSRRSELAKLIMKELFVYD